MNDIPGFNSVIVRYGEISLKGKNRINFELKLKSNIEKALEIQREDFSRVILKRGRIYIKGIKDVPELKNVLGIYSYSPALEIKKGIEELEKEVVNFFPVLKGKRSFRVSCQRLDKKFPYTSVEIERKIGEILFENTKIPVKLNLPDLNFQIEIGEDNIYIFFEKIKGFAGLPYETAGKLVSLFSAGIDSPVATFLMMKRGVEPVLVHFKITDKDYEKVLKLKKKLEVFTCGKEIELYVIKRDELFNEKFSILYKNKKFHPYMCVLCKYLMHKKAGEIAKQVNAEGIITGDNLAQVASQTLKNLFVYTTVSGFPVYSPLISFDKQETIKIAKEIGTYDISIMKSEGCIPPKHPKTGVSLEVFNKILEETGLE